MKLASKIIYLIKLIILLNFLYSCDHNKNIKIRNSADKKVEILNIDLVNEKTTETYKIKTDNFNEIHSLVINKILFDQEQDKNISNENLMVSPPASMEYTIEFKLLKNNEVYMTEIWLDRYGLALPWQFIDHEDAELINKWLENSAPATATSKFAVRPEY